MRTYFRMTPHLHHHHHHHHHQSSETASSEKESSIYRAAEAHSRSYAEAVRLGSKDVAVCQIAEKVHSHYGPRFTSFVLGQVLSLAGGTEEGVQRVTQHLERFNKAGLGLDIELVKLKIEVVSEDAAACFLTWRIYPQKESVAGWDWTNLYGFRRLEGKGVWEYAVSDQEIQRLLQRVPDFFTL